MSEQARLERRYRRLLACYPRAFRSEHEEEMLVVLLACARHGRQRPGVWDAANLLLNAMRMRLAPPTPRSNRSVLWGVRLLVVTACLELVALLVVTATRGAVDAAVLRHFAAGDSAHLIAGVQAQVTRVEIGASIVTAAWLVLAWANAGARRWARGATVALAMLTGLSLLTAIAHHAATYAPADLASGIALCLSAATATALIISTRADSHYRPRRHAGERPGPLAASDQSWN
jgi:hypothetical protein